VADFLTNCVTSFSGVYRINMGANKRLGVEVEQNMVA